MKIVEFNFKDGCPTPAQIKEIGERLEEDIKNISDFLHSQKTPNKKSCNKVDANKIILVLGYLLKKITSANFTQNENVIESLKLFAFLLSRHADKLSDNADGLKEKCKEIFETLGYIPTLGNKPTLPDEKFLPARFQQSKADWAVEPLPEPTRGRDITFIPCKFLSTSANRAHLSTKLIDSKNFFIFEHSNEKYIYNILDNKFYKLDLMHADHFQASAKLIASLQLLIKAMNLDPTFAAEILKKYENEGYFVRDENGKIIGSKWLYMLYHNAVENIWFLLCSYNSGNSKGTQDPIEWLEQHEIGKEFLNHLKEKELLIDKREIFYRVGDKPLQKVFIEWYMHSHYYQLQLANKTDEDYIKEKEKHYKLRTTPTRVEYLRKLASPETPETFFHQFSLPSFSVNSAEETELQNSIKDVSEDPRLKAYKEGYEKLKAELMKEKIDTAAKRKLSFEKEKNLTTTPHSFFKKHSPNEKTTSPSHLPRSPHP